MQEYDISSNEWREYTYSNGVVYRIEKPMKLYIKEGGTGHRIVDSAGVTHWLPVNMWYSIKWYAPTNPVSF